MLISKPENEINISFITFWEISLKYAIGKLELHNVKPDDLPGIAEEAGLSLLAVSLATISSFYRLPRKAHKDPFDRMLIWQAVREDMTLVSKDSTLAKYTEDGLRFVW